jgi:hypothetical protein
MGTNDELKDDELQEAAELLNVANKLRRQTRRRMHTAALVSALLGVEMLVVSGASGLGLSRFSQAVVASVLTIALGLYTVRRWNRARDEFGTGPPPQVGYGILFGTVPTTVLFVLITRGRTPSTSSSLTTSALLIVIGLLYQLNKSSALRIAGRVEAAGGLLILVETLLWPHSLGARRTATAVVLLLVALVLQLRTNRMTEPA